MIQKKRYERIAEIVNDAGIADMDALCAAVGASRGTVRRDLIRMEENGLLKRTRGGAHALPRQPEDDLPIHMRGHLHSEQKARIAQAALALVRDGDTVLLGAGTTVRALAARLSALNKLTVVTYDIGVAYEIASRTNHRLLVAGGWVRERTFTLYGGFTEAFLRDTRIDCAFLSADALDAKAGFMDYNADEITLKRIALNNAERRVMLLDQSKLGIRALMAICKPDEVDLTILDGPLDAQTQSALAEAGVITHIV